MTDVTNAGVIMEAFSADMMPSSAPMKSLEGDLWNSVALKVI